MPSIRRGGGGGEGGGEGGGVTITRSVYVCVCVYDEKRSVLKGIKNKFSWLPALLSILLPAVI